VAYKEVNSAFLRFLLPVIRAGDVVWVHDYHLQLLPKLIRDNTGEIPGAPRQVAGDRTVECCVSIVFFLHIPFPTSQIFRSLPQATELLESVMAADVVGFHAFDYTRHFFNAAKRMLGVKQKSRAGGVLALVVDDREVVVTMSAISIEAHIVSRACDSSRALDSAQALRALYPDCRIVCGYDVGQRLSGVILKLQAFEKLLNESRDSAHHNRTVLVQVSLIFLIFLARLVLFFPSLFLLSFFGLLEKSFLWQQ
jgi:trehalose 6-phosphate synthase/phosphatase